MNQVELYCVGDKISAVEPGVRRRDWLVPHAYKCLPVTTINSLGWDIYSREEMVLERQPDGKVKVLAGEVSPHFGMDTVTFEQGFLWKTPPGVHLLVMPVPNQFNEGWFAMAAAIETDVIDYPWFVTLRLTQDRVTIPAGTPLVRVMLTDISMTADANIKITTEPTEVAMRRLELSQAREEADKKADRGQGWTQIYLNRSKVSKGLRTAAIEKLVPEEGPFEYLRKHGVMAVGEFLSPEECEAAMALWDPERVSQQGGDYWAGRVCHPEWPDELKRKMIDWVEAKAASVFGEEKLYVRNLNLTLWNEGQEMSPHTDHGADNEFPGRKYAAVVYLNDGYEGGNLYFPDLMMGVRPLAGTLLMFPGGKLRHGVTKITKGKRLTAISWLGPTQPQA